MKLIFKQSRAIWLLELSGCTKNEKADKKLWLFKSAPMELTMAENFKTIILVKTEREIGKIIVL